MRNLFLLKQLQRFLSSRDCAAAPVGTAIASRADITLCLNSQPRMPRGAPRERTARARGFEFIPSGQAVINDLATIEEWPALS